jgi:hypothetical protein
MPERRDGGRAGILDRIVHRAHRLDLRGESLRKNPPKLQQASS